MMLRFPVAIACSMALLSTLVPAAGPTAPPSAARVPTGRVTEWAVPTNQAVRDPAVDTDGSVFFAVSKGDRIVRFDPRTRHFTEWKLAAGTLPHGVVVTGDGKVFVGGRGNGTLVELDPATGKIRTHATLAGESDIYSVAHDAQDNIWFTQRKSHAVGRLDRATGSVRNYPMSGGPYGVVQDRQGRIWTTLFSDDRLAILDPRTGETSEIPTGVGSRPRRIDVAPDGMIWVTLYGTGKAITVDPATRRIVREYDFLGGSTVGPYSVVVGRDGRVWVSLYQSDSVAILDPGNPAFRVVPLPNRQSGVRNATVDATGRFWYLATSLGKLGMID